ncbi:hypothetical protein IFR05_000539 [Cadophora sp. M221]|nr:hypothetical protein IFR05_000539 [Cadophora sp. M221]
MASRRLPTTDLFSLKGKTVIATGATGGLGTEMCLSLAEAGANIVALLLPGDKATPALSNLVTETGRSFTSFECDVSNTSAVREVFSKIWSCSIAPDILLNCAGLNRRHPIVDMTDADIDLIFALNLKGVYVASQEFGRRLIALNRPGKIVNIASITSFIANVNVSAYATSKGGVLQMTKAFSNEWASKNIQVNCICPGYFKTPLTQELVNNPEFDSSVLDRTPAGRWGEPDDLRGAVLFLASQASNYVSGASIVVDGGMLGK